MDFIEQWFGVSPDGRDGSLETPYTVAVVAVVAAMVFCGRIGPLIQKLHRARLFGGH
jgi:hypothetical protein